MMWLEEHAGKTSFHGVDIDQRAISWSQQHLPFADFQTNDPLPPLPYPDQYFDLVFNHSVFTHIDESYQDRWLAELHRVTTPGAFLILSVHGDFAFKKFEEAFAAGNDDPGPFREQFTRQGIVFIDDDNWMGGSFPDFYHTTYHATWYVFSHWARFFKVKAYLPQGDLDFQDLVVLERLDGDLPEAASSRSEAGPPIPSIQGPQADPNSGPGQRAADLIARGPDPAAPTNWPWAAGPFRRVVLRALRNYMSYQGEVDRALLESIQRASQNAPVSAHSVLVLRDALKRQGERVNRLEADLMGAIDELKSEKQS